MNNKTSNSSKLTKKKPHKYRKAANQNNSKSNETLTQISSLSSDNSHNRQKYLSETEDKFTIRDTETSKTSTDTESETDVETTSETETFSDGQSKNSKINKVIDYIKVNRKQQRSSASSDTDGESNSSHTVVKPSKGTQYSIKEPFSKSQFIQTNNPKNVHLKCKNYPKPSENFEYLSRKKENSFLLYDIIEDTNVDILNFLNDLQREDCLERQICDAIDGLIYKDEEQLDNCKEVKFRKPMKPDKNDSDQIPKIDANATVTSSSKNTEPAKCSKQSNSFDLPNGTTINIPIYNYQPQQIPMVQPNQFSLVQPAQYSIPPRFQTPCQNVRIPNPSCRIHGNKSQMYSQCSKQPMNSQITQTHSQKNDNMQEFYNSYKFNRLNLNADRYDVSSNKLQLKDYNSRQKQHTDSLVHWDDFDF